jgi:hypothetical protein
MRMAEIPMKPEVPDALTVPGSLERSTKLLWHGRSSWFKVFFAWWLLPIVVVVWWMIIFGESINRSTAEFNVRRAVRDQNLRDRGLI